CQAAPLGSMNRAARRVTNARERASNVAARAGGPTERGEASATRRDGIDLPYPFLPRRARTPAAEPSAMGPAPRRAGDVARALHREAAIRQGGPHAARPRFAPPPFRGSLFTVARTDPRGARAERGDARARRQRARADRADAHRG